MIKNLAGGLFTVVIALVPLAFGPLEAADTWVNATGTLAGKLSECGNLTLLSPVPGSDAIIAGIASRGLWQNKGGNTWSHLGDGAGSQRITNRPSWIVYDPMNPEIFWESGIYNGVGVFKTADGGKTFQRLGTLTHNDYVSVDFTDPERRTLLAGGHEVSRTVHLSTDGGQTWTNVGVNLPAGSGASTNPFVINSQTYIVNAFGSASGSGVYRSTNGGKSWEQVSTLGPWGPPLRASNGNIYWSVTGGVLRSTDSGLTWSQGGNGLKQVQPVELPDGRLASVGETTLVISADSGATWSPIGDPLPYSPNGLMYSPQRKAFFIWRNDCRDEVLPDAVMRLDFDVSAPTPTAPALSAPAPAKPRGK
jgi:photosystem II stability/assembly factor-like uncharacterized protein